MVKKSHTAKIKCKYGIEKFNWKVTSRSCSYVFFKGENNNYYYFQVVIVIFIPIYHSCLVVSTLCLVPHLPQGCLDLVLTLLGLYQTWIKCQDHQDAEGDLDHIQTFLPAFFNQREKQCQLKNKKSWLMLPEKKSWGFKKSKKVIKHSLSVNLSRMVLKKESGTVQTYIKKGSW